MPGYARFPRVTLAGVGMYLLSLGPHPGPDLLWVWSQVAVKDETMSLAPGPGESLQGF
jgi:hypothetical protein